jgi:predicted nucleotidyltransferase
MDSILLNNEPAIRDLCNKHHILSLFAFGSVTDGSFNKNSDIDLMYEFDFGDFNLEKQPISEAPFDPFNEYHDLKDALEKLLKRKVDLIPFQKFKNPVFRDQVAKTKVQIYGRERYQEVLV